MAARSRRTRITESREFDRVYKRGAVYRGKLFSVHTYPNILDTPRLGLSVSKKVGNAVIRNTLRRRLREIFRAASTNVRRDLDLVVSARPSAAGVRYADLEDEFHRALEKLGAGVEED